MFLLLLFVGILLSVYISNNASGGVGKKHCEKQHKWVVRFDDGDKRGYLICKNCDKIPGEDI